MSTEAVLDGIAVTDSLAHLTISLIVARGLAVLAIMLNDRYSDNESHIFFGPVGVVVKDTASGTEVRVRFPGRSNRTQSRQRLATAATFGAMSPAELRRRGDGPRHSLHILA